MKLNYANRPSEGDREFVRRADGQMVKNLAFVGRKSKGQTGSRRTRVFEAMRARRRNPDDHAKDYAQEALKTLHRDGVPQPELDDMRTAVNRGIKEGMQKGDSDAGIAMLNRIAAGELGGTMSVNGDVPTRGLALSPFPERSLVKDVADFRAQDINDYIRDNADELGRDGRFLGYWVNEGKIYLDVSIVTGDAGLAREVCERRDQKAFFDIGMGQECTVNMENRSGQ